MNLAGVVKFCEVRFMSKPLLTIEAYFNEIVKVAFQHSYVEKQLFYPEKYIRCLPMKFPLLT